MRLIQELSHYLFIYYLFIFYLFLLVKLVLQYKEKGLLNFLLNIFRILNKFYKLRKLVLILYIKYIYIFIYNLQISMVLYI